MCVCVSVYHIFFIHLCELFEDLMLSEMNQADKNTYYVLSLI